ncbi:Hypothetical Protein RRSL_04702 [Ralstonia solanacearum UW551]|uniref:Transmembrane protein n=1 Tax=Ralstonia solanacearum (strain UW551) TaxID=342110 RepID=A0AB33VJ01_RALSU|nr:Hypothetical Protein RRSL_04702 [Ralstonia solanacearum UW551]
MTVASGVPSPFRSILTVLPGSAVPDSVVPSVGFNVGVSGAVVSTVRVNVVLASLVLPAASVAVTVMLWLPSARAVPGLNVQLPEASAVVVPIAVPLS